MNKIPSYKTILTKYLNKMNINYSDIQQVGKMQMAVVKLNNYDCLFSYLTLIGINLSDDYMESWRIINIRHSITTSKQTNKFLSHKRFTKIDENDFSSILMSNLVIDNQLAYILINYKIMYFTK